MSAKKLFITSDMHNLAFAESIFSWELITIIVLGALLSLAVVTMPLCTILVIKIYHLCRRWREDRKASELEDTGALIVNQDED